ARLLGPGVSLASVSNWADDVRESRPETTRWHFVDIPLEASSYDAALHCRSDAVRGDCVVAELERLRIELRCAATRSARSEALRFAVHFVADVHQPFHTIGDARGGNQVSLVVQADGNACRGSCTRTPTPSNLHAIWDNTLVQKAGRNWGATVESIEKE